jgi:cytochrome c
MKRLIVSLVAAVTLTLVAAVGLTLVAAPSAADPMMDLAKSKQCLSCHAVTGELTAPSFDSIAKKYHGMKNADIALAWIVQHGGTQHYGCNAMPSAGARVAVSDADAKALVEWILNMKK